MNENVNLSAEEAFGLAIKNHQAKNFNAAINFYNIVLKINPNHVVTLNNLGILFRALGENQKAKSCFEKIIEINPNHVDALNSLGVIFRIFDENQKAKSCFERAIEINPNYENSYNNLGNIFKELNENEKAVNCYKKLIKINPKSTIGFNNLGIIFQELGEYQNALICFEKAIEISPNDLNLINGLSFLLKAFKFDHKEKSTKNILKKLFLFLFKKNNINHKNIAINAISLLISENEQDQLLDDIESDLLLNNKFLQNLLKDELFCLILQKALIADKFLEKLLTKLRKEILLYVEKPNKDNLNDYLNFIISLSEQCWLNEYVFIQSEKETNIINELKNKIENSDKINRLEIAILGTYIPLNNSKIIIEKLLNYKSSNILFDDLINIQIKEPLKELELIKTISSLDIIDDPVSKKVRNQYEENPYPRWRFSFKYSPSNFFKCLNADIRPNKIKYNSKFNNSNILIAGCGTGNHISQASRYLNANILAVDLSLKSLAYAKRKSEEQSFKNVKYLHADILKLNKLNKKFDIIESLGTLHHMRDPKKGLEKLLDILEPHGFLKLGLYSETARQGIIKFREIIKKKNLENTNENIKNFRQDIIKNKVDPLIQNISLNQDFYSTSAVRDLLFHVQEHCFTIPQISKILQDFNLEFLGFTINNDFIKSKYSQSFPKDIKNTSLDNWHQFEINNPNTFIGMYQFWVKRK